MILPIYLYGQPVLRKPTEDIGNDYPELDALIDNMFQTMYQSDGVGLAAPQVGLPIRLFVIDATPMKEDCTTAYLKSWTIQSTKLWPDIALS